MSEERKSIAQLKSEMKQKFKTYGQTCSDFRVGDEVKVIVPCQDFHYFNGDIGRVVEIKDEREHLSIKIKFDKPREFCDETGEPWKQETFCFEPEDLITFKNFQRLFYSWGTI